MTRQVRRNTHGQAIGFLSYIAGNKNSYIGCLVVTVVRVHRLRGNVTITSRGRFTHSEKCDVDSAFHVRLKQSRFLILHTPLARQRDDTEVGAALKQCRLCLEALPGGSTGIRGTEPPSHRALRPPTAYHLFRFGEIYLCDKTMGNPYLEGCAETLGGQYIQ